MISVQLGASVGEAFTGLRACAVADDRSCPSWPPTWWSAVSDFVRRTAAAQGAGDQCSVTEVAVVGLTPPWRLLQKMRRTLTAVSSTKIGPGNPIHAHQRNSRLFMLSRLMAS